MSELACPICAGRSTVVEEIDGNSVAGKIREILPDIVEEAPMIASYRLCACLSCGLEFANPMKPGSDQFYEWICAAQRYYPAVRWEWEPLIEILKARGVASVLDIGCGSGQFLQEINNLPIRSVGIDLNPESINQCIERGLRAKCLSVEKAVASDELGKFDALTLFHVLEHLPNPKDLILTLKRLLTPRGFIALSVPYSPMSFERDWYDPLNRPPHHLTRWNRDALGTLAASVDMQAQIYVQPPSSMLSTSATIIALKHQLKNVANMRFRKLVLMGRLMAHPLTFASSLINQSRRRAHLHGNFGDAVLLILENK